jgi:hypothetical protein
MSRGRAQPRTLARNNSMRLWSQQKAWVHRRQVGKDRAHIMQERPWAEAFQECADDFIDQLLDENRALFEELSRL